MIMGGGDMALNACEVNIVAAKKISQFLPPLPGGGRQDGQRFRGIDEPALREILQDPVFRSLLASDGVQQDHLMELIQAVRARLNPAY
jgi:hypothetical protein